MQKGFSIGLIFGGMFIIGLGGAVTYTGLKAFELKNKPVAATSKVNTATPQSDSPVVLEKEGKLVSQIGSGFPKKLESCEVSTTEFIQSIGNFKLSRVIKGFSGSNCIYEEEMPNDVKTTCTLNEKARREYAAYFSEIAAGDSISTSTKARFNSSSSSKTTIVDGKKLSFDPTTLFNDGSCVVTGYDELIETL